MPAAFPAAGPASGSITLLIAAVLGLLSLFFGRRLFYVFVGLAGFAFGLGLGASLVRGEAEWLQLLLGIVIGVLLALLAVFLQRPAAAIGGFFAFAAIGRLLGAGLTSPAAAIVLAVVLGIVGLVLVWMFFDWGLILASSLIGAAALTLVVRAVTAFRYPLGLIVFIVLLVIGVAFQARELSARPP